MLADNRLVPVYANSWNAPNQLLLVLMGGVAVALMCGCSTCGVTYWCVESGTCVRSGRGICEFSNEVRFSALHAYSTVNTASLNTEHFASNASSHLSVLLRGLCSPGDRSEYNRESGQLECVSFYPFPSGINTEITNSQGSTPAERACGKWIDAGGSTMSQMYVFRRGNAGNNSEWVRQLEIAEEAATASSRTASTAMAKFRAECERTSLLGQVGIRAAAQLSYEHLAQHAERTAVSKSGFLRAIGFQMSHRCESTTSVSVALMTTGTFRYTLASGWMFSRQTLSKALNVFGEPPSVQEDAEDASLTINEWYQFHRSPLDGDALEFVNELSEVMHGAIGHPINVSRANHEASLLSSASTYFDFNPVKARAYLKGIAAFCAYTGFSSFLSTTTTDTSKLYEDSSYTSHDNHLRGEIARIRAARRPATALGRTTTDKEDVDLTNDPNNAMGTTLAQVIGDSGSAEDLTMDCVGVMRKVFSDEVEAARFSASIGHAFYERLRAFVLTMRQSLQEVAHIEPIRNLLRNSSSFSHRVANAGIRIAGAPRGSWAGISRPIPRGNIASADGMFIQILKQARASWLDDVYETAVKQGVHKCDHSPFFSHTSWNAYILLPLDCSVYFLGLAHRPMLDAQYDDATMLSRGLHVVGHEFAHIAEDDGWIQENVSILLHHYHPDTYPEALPDVLSAVAVLNTGMVSRHDFLTLFCQVWCARTPFGFTHPKGAVHPTANDRCNFLAATLDEFFPQVGR